MLKEIVELLKGRIYGERICEVGIRPVTKTAAAAMEPPAKPPAFPSPTIKALPTAAGAGFPARPSRGGGCRAVMP